MTPPINSHLHPTWDHLVILSILLSIQPVIGWIIEKIKPKTSSGPDGQSSKLLKAVGNTLAPTLSIMVNQSLYSGIFPDRLKIAK